jgi:hypothetical protein
VSWAEGQSLEDEGVERSVQAISGGHRCVLDV